MGNKSRVILPGKDSLKSLPEGVWLNSIGCFENVLVCALQFVLNEKIQFDSGEVSPEYTAVQKMAQLGVPLKRFVDRQQSKGVGIVIEHGVFGSLTHSPRECL